MSFLDIILKEKWFEDCIEETVSLVTKVNFELPRCVCFTDFPHSVLIIFELSDLQLFSCLYFLFTRTKLNLWSYVWYVVATHIILDPKNRYITQNTYLGTSFRLLWATKTFHCSPKSKKKVQFFQFELPASLCFFSTKINFFFFNCNFFQFQSTISSGQTLSSILVGKDRDCEEQKKYLHKTTRKIVT